MLQCREYVLEQHGADGIEQVKAVMDPSAREVVYAPTLLATDWIETAYGIEHAAAYNRAFPRLRPWEASDHMIAQVLVKHWGGLYRPLFAGATTPLAVLEKSARIWSRMYDSGESQMIVVSPTSVIKRLNNCPDMPRDHERLAHPYWEQLLRQVGATPLPSKHTKCVALGAKWCETLLEWREPRESASQ
ncbi:MAG: hypothetical protein RL701_2558 [Pseudomonadota bacterium]